MTKEQKRILAVCEIFDRAPDDLVFWAFRYFMGRMTIANVCFAKDLARAWDLLWERTRAQIEKELEEAFEEDDASEGGEYRRLGMDCDRAAWELVRAEYKKVGE